MPQYSDDLFLGSAPTFMGLSKDAISTVFSGTISTTTLTVTSLQSGDPIVLGMYVAGSSVTAGSYITAFGSGTGGVGTYTLSASSTVGSAETMYGSGNAFLGDPAPMSNGVGPLGRIYNWDVVPATAEVNNISVAVAYASAGNATLVAGTNSTAVVNNAGQTVIQLDCPRAVSVTTGTGTPTSANFTVSGYDYYGQPMTEIIASGTVASTTTSGKKAFYQVASVSVSGSTGGVTVSIGVSNVLGSPVRIIDAGYIVRVGWNNTLADDAGTFVAADMTNPATSSTGDVRGTYTPSAGNPPNGQRRLVLSIAIPAIGSGPYATRLGALGVTQA
jgi:hypothetical protein